MMGGSTLATPLSAEAQQLTKVPRIGLLGGVRTMRGSGRISGKRRSFTLAFEYQSTVNMSNLALFDYTRNVYTMMIAWSY